MIAVFSILTLKTGDCYAGIGARGAPQHIRELMTGIASFLADRGIVLRSGGAESDADFELGAGALKEVFLPWGGFNRHDSCLFDCYSDEHYETARRFHPASHLLSCGQMAKAIRRTAQIYGLDFSCRVKCIICWEKTSSVGAISLTSRIAHSECIPVLNLHDEEVERELRRVISHER